MDQLFLKVATILCLTLFFRISLANPNHYLKPKYTEEGGFLLDHLKYRDVLEVEQKNLPTSLHTVFKLVMENVTVNEVVEEHVCLLDLYPNTHYRVTHQMRTLLTTSPR